MEDYKEKLLIAVQDGILDANEVIEKLLSYMDDETVQQVIEEEDWEELCGIRALEDNEEDEY
ncbi:MAG: hypothetical protein MJ211_09545 [Bacteroidales bacterium]|nr:hypothetical protein [Bacteroidales bacterium]